MDETYVKVKGPWIYLYRAVDKKGETVDFMLSEKRDEPAARAFFKKAIGSSGVPDKAIMDKLAPISQGSIQLTCSWPCFL